MGLNQLFKSLQEQFPQIDARVLRAVAIEHSKDADAAVEAVLEEIIPFFTERSRPSIPLTVTLSAGPPAEDPNGYDVSGGSGRGPHDAHVGHITSFIDDYDENFDSQSKVVESELTEQVVESNIKLSADVYSHSEPDMLVNKTGLSTLQIVVSEVPEADGNSSTDKFTESCVESLSENISCLTPENLQTVDVGVHGGLDLNQQPEDFDNFSDNDFGVDTSQKGDQEKASLYEKNSVNGPDSLTIHGQMSSTLDSSVQALPDMEENISENIGVILPSDAASKIDTTCKVVGIEYESSVFDALSQSKQIQVINVLEEIISDARNYKKTLFSAMESVISLMKEVESKEQAAELAKEEASMGGTAILDKVEELNKMLQHAKAANDMHAGEVYGEKAILTTELRELQSRVLALSDSRHKSLAVLNEMRQTLEVRLAAAENEIKCAEQEKLEKEKCARKALADQELIMEKVVQESNILKQQAEDNAKLQEFLLDRGRVVDVLQGEIAVICLDAMLLKEKLDERVPFSKSLSSSQTSCILASSSSSMRSLMIQEQVDPLPEQAESAAKTQKQDPVSSFDENVPEDEASSEEDGTSFDEKTTKADRKALVEEGWEIFDNQDLQA